jgi:hypothetical protein
VSRCRISPYSAEDADSPAGGRVLGSLVCHWRTFFSRAILPVHFRRPRGRSRSIRRGSGRRSYSAARPCHAPLPVAPQLRAAGREVTGPRDPDCGREPDPHLARNASRAAITGAPTRVDIPQGCAIGEL